MYIFYFSTIDWYKFYLSFENSLCDDYITEKFFNILKHNTVPVALGAPKKVKKRGNKVHKYKLSIKLLF